MNTIKAKELLTELLESAGFSINAIEIEKNGETEHCFNIIPESHAQILIGHRGITLSSFQLLFKQVLRQQELVPADTGIRLDVDSYRKKQEQHVLDIADSRAQEVLRTNVANTLPPMSSFFRRLVHMHVAQNYSELKTHSVGMAHNRAVKISHIDSEESTSSFDVPADIYADLNI